MLLFQLLFKFLARLLELLLRFGYVYAVVYSPTKTAVTGKDSFRDFRGNPYGFRLIGDLKTRYSLQSIERSDIEELAKCCHLQYIVNSVSKGEEDKVRDSLYRFEHFEYYRRTSTAQAVYLEAFCLLAEKQKTGAVPTLENEHKRWNAFMRAEGYICGKRDDIAKRHNDLVPFAQLVESEKQKDDQQQMYEVIKKRIKELPAPQETKQEAK